MDESITFRFNGDLASSHKMNFYEVARFQYAAARWLVKLARYRLDGQFPKSISSRTNISINLVSQSSGSFNINVEDNSQEESDAKLPDAKIADLMAYVSERLIEKIAGDQQAETLKALDRLIEKIRNDETELTGLSDRDRDNVLQRIAEQNRDETLYDRGAALHRIDEVDGQRLVAMSAPLIREMGTALRKSADTLEVVYSSRGQRRSILFLNKRLSETIESTRMDDFTTPITANITQFNKDTGWGKLKIENDRSIVSFNIPYDVLSRVRSNFIESMKADRVNLLTYFVRDLSREVVRVVVIGILPTPVI